MSLFDSLNANTTAAAPAIPAPVAPAKPEPKFYNIEDLKAIKHRSRLLGYPAMLATWGFGALGTATMLTDAVSGLEAHAILGCVVAGGTLLGYKVAKWLIGKREVCNHCGAANSFTESSAPTGKSECHGDYIHTEYRTNTTCSACDSYNNLITSKMSLTDEAYA